MLKRPSIHWKHLRSPRLWVVIVLLAVGIWAARTIPISDIWKTLRALDPIQLAAWVLLNLFILCLISSRWWLLLRSMGHTVPYFPLTVYRLASFAISYFTPGPQMGGEALQVYLVQHRHQVPNVDSLSAVALDKLLELFGNYLFICIGGVTILSIGIFPRGLQNQLMGLMATVLLFSAIYVAAVVQGRLPLSKTALLLVHVPLPALFRSWVEKSTRIVTRSEQQIGQFFREKPWVLFQVIVVTTLIWLLSLLDFALALRFLGLYLPLGDIISALTLARIAFLVPTPGGLGALEASQVLVMQALGFSPAFGISLTILFRGRDLLMGSLGLGLVSWITR